MARGRKKQATVSTAPDDEQQPPPQGDNDTLTETEKAALWFHHKRRLVAAWATVEEAKKAAKKLETVAKDDLGKEAIKSIKEMIESLTPEGEAKLRKEAERRLAVFRLMNIGTQLDIFDQPDRTPAVDRAKAEGMNAGMEGVPKKPPYEPSLPQYEAWMDGYDVGQRAIFKIGKLMDAREFDDGGLIKGAHPDPDAENLDEDIGDQAETTTQEGGDAAADEDEEETDEE